METKTLNEVKADNYFLAAVSLGSFGFIIFSFMGLYVFGILGIMIAQILVTVFTFSFSHKAKKYGSPHKAGFIFGIIDSTIVSIWIMMLVISGMNT